MRSGQRAFGENYVQEAVAKMAALADLPDIEWHLIGPLQSNKARAAAAHFAWVRDASTGWRSPQRLSAARAARPAPLDVCVQVNVSGEAIEERRRARRRARARARRRRAAAAARCAASWASRSRRPTSARQRAQFRALRECFDACAADGLAVDTLSMGMSADLEAAIAEGATLVRVGTAMFGRAAST